MLKTIDTNITPANKHLTEIIRTHEEFLSTYNKYSVFVPIALEGMFLRYIDIETTRSVTMTFEELLNNPLTDTITSKPSNDPGYSKMLLREIKKLIEMN